MFKHLTNPTDAFSHMNLSLVLFVTHKSIKQTKRLFPNQIFYLIAFGGPKRNKLFSLFKRFICQKQD